MTTSTELIPTLKSFEDFVATIANKLSDGTSNIDGAKFALYNFKPPVIDLTNIPLTSGTFNAKNLLTDEPIFGSGTYKVTNCIIDVNDEIVNETYTWNFSDPRVTCPLSIITFDINDDTACDYYYYHPDYYTPVSSYPNNQLAESTVTIKKFVLFLAMKYFGLLQKRMVTSIYGLNYVKKQNGTFEVCVLNTYYVKNIKFHAGLSLSFLESITPPARTSIHNFQIKFLKFVGNLTFKIVDENTIENPSSLGNLPLSGKIVTTPIDNSEYAILVAPANPKLTDTPGVGSLGECGSQEYLIIIGRPNVQPQDTSLVQ